MDYKEIKKLIDDMGESKLDSLDIEFPDGIKISMTKGGIKQLVEVKQEVPVVANEIIEENKKEELVEGNDDYFEITSPMVGTFYLKPSPDAENFVNVGDKISQGKVVCIVEAMKLMNEIESEYSGEIVEICVKDGEMVEYGTTLFKIK